MDPANHLDEVGALVDALRAIGSDPVLVGGMALVTLGSRRVTRDFDFLIAHPGDRLDELVSVFYDRGPKLASRLAAQGDVTAIIGNRRVAAIRLRLDAPATAFFLHPGTGLRVDLLFDFPVSAGPIAARAKRTTIASHKIAVATRADQLALKRLALARRQGPGDAEDVVFLERGRRRR